MLKMLKNSKFQNNGRKVIYIVKRGITRPKPGFSAITRVLDNFFCSIKIILKSAKIITKKVDIVPSKQTAISSLRTCIMHLIGISSYHVSLSVARCHMYSKMFSWVKFKKKKNCDRTHSLRLQWLAK